MNWKSTIEDLLQRGHTYASIGAEIGATGQAVRAFMVDDTRNPRWHTGDKLIAMHKKAMRKYPKIDTAA